MKYILIGYLADYTYKGCGNGMKSSDIQVINTDDVNKLIGAYADMLHYNAYLLDAAYDTYDFTVIIDGVMVHDHNGPRTNVETDHKRYDEYCNITEEASRRVEVIENTRRLDRERKATEEADRRKAEQDAKDLAELTRLAAKLGKDVK